MASVHNLYRLQTIDRAIAHVRGRLREIEARLAGDAELQALQRLVDSLTAQVSSMRARVRNSELESQGLSEKIASVQARLYGGQVTNPRELASLQDEVDYLRRRQRRLEDEILETMIQLDEQEGELERQQERLSQATARWETLQASLQAEQAELEAQMRQLQSQRSMVQEMIPSGDLSLYEDLRRRKGGIAVVPLESQSCGGCGVRLPTSMVQQIRQAETLHFCPSCGRILCSR